jgi:hypothetical protein
MDQAPFADWTIYAGAYMVLSGICFEAWWNTRKRSGRACMGFLLLWLVISAASVGMYVLWAHYQNKK